MTALQCVWRTGCCHVEKCSKAGICCAQSIGDRERALGALIDAALVPVPANPVPPPCDCCTQNADGVWLHDCTCMNIGDAQRVAVWCSEQNDRKPKLPTVPDETPCYDAGLLSDFGGGNVDWWWDYLRAELGRAHDFYAHQIEQLRLDLAQQAMNGQTVIEQQQHMRNLEGEVARLQGLLAIRNAREVIPSKEQVERDFMQWVRDNHFSFSQDTNGNINLSKARVMELFVASRRAAETPAEPHWPLIDTALQGAANALPVLFTMLTKVGLREGAMVADEINGNVLCAIKQLAHVRRPPVKAPAPDICGCGWNHETCQRHGDRGPRMLCCHRCIHVGITRRDDLSPPKTGAQP